MPPRYGKPLCLCTILQDSSHIVKYKYSSRHTKRVTAQPEITGLRGVYCLLYVPLKDALFSIRGPETSRRSPAKTVKPMSKRLSGKKRSFFQKSFSVPFSSEKGTKETNEAEKGT